MTITTTDSSYTATRRSARSDLCKLVTPGPTKRYESPKKYSTGRHEDEFVGER